MYRKVIRILDNENPKLCGYVMFEDNWVSEFDKTLYNQNGEVFLVLGFHQLVEDVPILPILPILSTSIKRAYKQKFSCVKLDKVVNVGECW